MSPKKRELNPTERLWRRIFLGIYLAFTICAVLVTFFSVLIGNMGSATTDVRSPQISPRADNLDELRHCHRNLERLLTDLHKETFALQAKALRYDIEPIVEWRNWSDGWRTRWRTLAWRCRLNELGGEGVSAELDKMYAIHGALDELQNSYNAIVDNFVEKYVDRLHKLRTELNNVRSMIDSRDLPGRASTASGDEAARPNP